MSVHINGSTLTGYSFQADTMVTKRWFSTAISCSVCYYTYAKPLTLHPFIVSLKASFICKTKMLHYLFESFNCNDFLKS